MPLTLDTLHVSIDLALLLLFDSRSDTRTPLDKMVNAIAGGLQRIDPEVMKHFNPDHDMATQLLLPWPACAPGICSALRASGGDTDVFIHSPITIAKAYDLPEDDVIELAFERLEELDEEGTRHAAD